MFPPTTITPTSLTQTLNKIQFKNVYWDYHTLQNEIHLEKRRVLRQFLNHKSKQLLHVLDFKEKWLLKLSFILVSVLIINK